MPRPNRGKTVKFSIRLSTTAKQRIASAAKNLGTSSAGVILFELAKIIKNPPPVSKVKDIEDEITLEKDHFVMTITEHLKDKVDQMSEDYGMKKNVLFGYILSDYFEKLEIKEAEKTDQQKIQVKVNTDLKKKMIKYSEENFVPLSAIVSHSILKGPSSELPYNIEGETDSFFTNVPEYVLEIIRNESEDLNIREHFYTFLCINKQFNDPSGRFFA